MKLRIAWTLLLGSAFIGLTMADEPAKTAAGPLVVTDSKGKELTLKTWKFASGTQRLPWLAPKGKPNDGPEALEIRELDSTSFAEGVMTLVPLTRLRTLQYDGKADTVKLTAATGPKDTEVVTLTGSTGFKNTNRPTIEGEGEKGVEMFMCGVEMGIKAAKFAKTKVEAQPAGRPSELTTRKNGDDATIHKISDFQPRYRFADGREILSPTLYCKTAKVELAKVTGVKRTAGLDGAIVWIISFQGKAADDTLTLLPTAMIDGKEATLIDFVGRVPAGYKLFPTKLIEEVEFDVKD